MQHIIAKDNQYLKLARSLKQKKYRSNHNLFLVEGIRNVRECVASSMEVSYGFFDAAKLSEPEISGLVQSLELKGSNCFSVETNIFATLGETEHSQGVILVVKQGSLNFTDFVLQLTGNALVVLDGLQDPGNVGTIMRTAWAAGVGGVVLLNNTADIYNPKVVRSAMGAIYNLPIITLDNAMALKLLQENAYSPIVADASGVPYNQLELPGKIAWIFGNEGAGPSSFWHEHCKYKVAIPMAANVESLNVAIAAGILMFSQIGKQ